MVSQKMTETRHVSGERHGVTSPSRNVTEQGGQERHVTLRGPYKGTRNRDAARAGISLSSRVCRKEKMERPNAVRKSCTVLSSSAFADRQGGGA